MKQDDRLDSLADELDSSAVAKSGGAARPVSNDGERKSQATQLIELAESCTLFHDADGNGYAVTPGTPREVWPVRQKGFKDWLRLHFYQDTGKGVGGQAMQDAVGTIEAKARFEGGQEDVYQRTAWHNGKIYIDLMNDDWKVIEVTTNGWKILDQSPVSFIRKKGMGPLPNPESGGALNELRPFINCSEEDFPLVIAWILLALRGKGPFIILVMIAQQGSGKSTVARVLRELVDPSSVPLRAPPREERDLAVMASNGWVIPLDNLSSLTSQMSDALCRLATGGGFSTRQLYTDQDEVLIKLERPLILNGITDFATRADLVDRSIFLKLPALENTRPEEEFWDDFSAKLPRIFGAILDVLCTTLRTYPAVRLPHPPRMADYAIWGTAAESALGLKRGGFMAAYQANIARGVELAIQGSVIGESLLEFMAERQQWDGTPAELLVELNELAGTASKTRSWPKSGQALRGELRRVIPPLNRQGIQVTLPDRERGIREITITKQEWTVKSLASLPVWHNEDGGSCQTSKLANESPVQSFPAT